MSVATFDAYVYATNLHLLPFFENVSLDEIDEEMIEKLISKLKFTRSRVRLILRPLNQILEKSKKSGLIKVNPIAELSSNAFDLHTVASDYEVNPFTSDEIKAILNHCKHETIRNILAVGFNTGMRIGEMFALTWPDIDFNAETISVNKAASIKGIIKEPKTSSGVRTIEMIPEAKAALLAQYEITGKDNNQVFKTPLGKIWIKTSLLGEYWRKALTSAGVSYRNPYQMRHTFISRMLELGNSPLVLYPMVGHKNAKIMFEKYARFIKKSGKLLKSS